ncbi:MAG TPA: DUF6036 family nucleotidyltransferase [Thermoanaerobaculia bacterium]|nr:DUF6036 family nucleotidyltransferase [Thermoanaerobaculia bacterium]
MRRLADARRIRRFLELLGERASRPARLYLVGGATAVLQGWRDSTIDVDLELVPDSDELLRAIASLKRELELNVELAAPHHFIPEVPGWQQRSPFVEQFGRLAVFHYDPYSQVLAKLERGHAKDLRDVESMVAAGLVEPERLRELFGAIEPELYRYPAVDPDSFRRAVEELAGRGS